MTALDPGRALDAACRKNDTTAVAALLDAGASPGGQAGLWPPLYVATGARAHATMTLLLARGAAVDGRADDPLVPLHNAQDAKGVQILVAAGADVELRRSAGTSLHLAAANGPPPVVTALLRAGADVNARDADDRTPLQIAAHLGRTAAIKVLLGSPPAAPVPWLVISEYAQRSGAKDLATLATLLTGLDPDEDPPPGHGHAVHTSAAAGTAEAMALLLKAGANPHRRNPAGRTPVFIAAQAIARAGRASPQQVVVVHQLVVAGADLDLECEGTTARILANGAGLVV